jgi:hypothetical protein
MRHAVPPSGAFGPSGPPIDRRTVVPTNPMSAASAGAAPPPAAMPPAIDPPADEAAALLPVAALPTPQYLDEVAAFYGRCLAAYDARNHQGTSGRKTACDTHRTYAITDLAARCAVRGARERGRGRRMDHTASRASADHDDLCVSTFPFALRTCARRDGARPTAA